MRITRKSDALVFHKVLGVIPFCREANAPVEAWRVFFENGSYQDYTAEQLLVEQEMKEEKGKNVLSYLRSVSQFSRIAVSDDVEIGLYKKYERLGFIAEDSPLADYLEAGSRPDMPGNKRGRVLDGYPIFPFGCNASQYKAVCNALVGKMSVIQGPPGTGKTQTILNIVANLIISSKSVEIVSNNNSAVQNIAEKLQKYDLAWLLAFLGNNENKTRFYSSQNGLYPDLIEWKCEDLPGLKCRINELCSFLQEGYAALERVASLEQELRDVRLQRELQAQVDSSGNGVSLWRKPKNSRGVLSVINDVESQVRGHGRLSIWQRVRLALKGVKLSANPDILSLETKYYEMRECEVEDELSKARAVSANIEAMSKEMQQLSLRWLRGVLYERYGNRGPARDVFEKQNVELRDARAFLSEYPIVLSTTFSATSNVSSDTVFDYLIMDEASQVDVAAGALALSVCRNAVVVGDEKQLPNVVTEEERCAAQLLWQRYEIAPGYAFEQTSFLCSVTTLMPWVNVTLLKEHYRCEPSIIGFCNAQFYGGELVCMRGEAQESGRPVLRLCSTGEGNFARGTVNRRQAEMIAKEILPEVMTQYSDVGVIAPYNNQVAVIREELDKAGYLDVQVATVHKFQGRENDAIILSTVDNNVRAFVDDPHLVNVAVSRAKNLFVLVVSGNEQPVSNVRDLMQYIIYHKGGVQESRLRSVFDLLYKEKAAQKWEVLAGRRHVSRFDSENLMWFLLKNILANRQYGNLDVIPFYPLRNLVGCGTELSDEERSYALHPWTHLDFLVYNKVTHEPVLAIEVDGTAYHFEGSDQSRRDAMKNSVWRNSD